MCRDNLQPIPLLSEIPSGLAQVHAFDSVNHCDLLVVSLLLSLRRFMIWLLEKSNLYRLFVSATI